MKLRILLVGRTKERYAAEGIEKYLVRLRPFADVEIVRIKEQKGSSPEAALMKEGERILRQAGPFVLLEERGRRLTSLEFASFLRDRASVEFVLGGAYGVSEHVRRAASDAVSLSAMTLTHDMARLVLLEQLYRAMMINSGREYHH
jgi:23S rRNA (pseudouridine1915-N3)-methyltransferase